MSDNATDGRVGKLTAEELAQRRETRMRRVAAVETINQFIKELPEKLQNAIKELINLEPGRQPNSLYSRIQDFIMGESIPGVDEKPPGKGKNVDDMTLFKAFRVATTDMVKIIYQAQEQGIWISATKKGRDTLYKFEGEGPVWPDVLEGYSGPLRKPRTKKVSEDNQTENNEQ